MRASGRARACVPVSGASRSKRPAANGTRRAPHPSTAGSVPAVHVAETQCMAEWRQLSAGWTGKAEPLLGAPLEGVPLR